ncbi:hypothetical protein JTE90_017171 [Oedothorax gibbosus]|uniref:Uncharacterized protein n=1 Tax=Oedothorax gibbosus TaxID=931172 RepID=A0AAV6V9J9_9ARAC|nr:hypothetical protein JTE90_017171 [Oedothorax gibbosus]
MTKYGKLPQAKLRFFVLRMNMPDRVQHSGQLKLRCSDPSTAVLRLLEDADCFGSIHQRLFLKAAVFSIL